MAFSGVTFSRGAGLFIGVDLIKDKATRTPATEEADYLVSRYFPNKVPFWAMNQHVLSPTPRAPPTEEPPPPTLFQAPWAPGHD